MEKKSEILENFKTAIGSTIKSLSNSENVEVSFGNQNLQSKKTSIKLPEIEQVNNKINYNQIRALADSKSLRLRFSDNKIFKSYEPDGNISKKLYKIAEKIRYEKLGSDQFKGVKNNIEKYYQERINSLDLKSSEDKILESFENYLRVKFFDSKNNKEFEKKLKTYTKDLNEKLFSLIKDIYENKSILDKIVNNLKQYSDKDVYNNIDKMLKEMFNEKD